MERKADLIIKNGKIITMDKNRSMAEAIAVRDGRIFAVGKNEEICNLGENDAVIVDLNQRTLLPGFIDAHSHFMFNGAMREYCVDLKGAPVGSINSIDKIMEALKKKAENTPSGELILGAGYDDTLLTEQRHPTRHDLDLVSTKHPIVILHASFHAISVNSLALRLAGINEQNVSEDINIGRDPFDGSLNGIFKEGPAMMPILKCLIKPDENKIMRSIVRSTSEYLSVGATSAQEGAAFPQMLGFFETAAKRGILKNRIQILPLCSYTPEESTHCKGAQSINEMLSIGAVKIISDGSLQAYTAYLSNPYYKQHPTMSRGGDLFRGTPAYPRQKLIDMVEQYHNNGWQIAIHANGDAAIDDVLSAFESAQLKNPRPDARHIIIHCQSVREDQLDRIKERNIVPSFYSSHVYYHGDRHRDLFLGQYRASRVHPCRSALERGIIFTNHNDSPCTPISPLMSVWSAVNRITASGKILGESQRIPVYEALKSVTINAAYQAFEENDKGSIESNKYADFVILDKNPLEIEKEKIKDIQITGTVVGGKFVYGE